MIVLDASAIIELLLNLKPGAPIVAKRIADEAPALYAPHLLDAEVGQVLRRFVLRGELGADDAVEALADLRDLPITRIAHGPLLNRAFELRDNATVYDALYLVLAESIQAPLLTADAALAKVPGHSAQVELSS